MVNNEFNPYRNIGIEELGNNVLRFHFLNGEIDFLERDYGAYAISSGCGSGKTTNIRNLINLRWYEGILYAAFTKNELNEMYQYIIHNLVGKSMDPHTGEVLKLDDVIVLHSDFMAAGVDLNLFRNYPDKLAEKKIVLCTHAKLLDEPLEVLLAAKFNQRIARSILPPLNSVVTAMASTLPRQWVIIDEGVDAKERTYLVPQHTFIALGEVISTEKVIDKSKGYRYITKELDAPKLVRKWNSYSEFIFRANEYSQALGVDLFPIRPDNKLNEIKFNQVASEVFNKFEYYSSKAKPNSPAKVTFNFTSMIMDGMKFHLMLFDGTSDLTLSTSKKFKVLGTDKPRYNSKVNLNLFPFSLNRRLDIKDPSINVDKYIRTELDNISRDLFDIISSNERTLIFTWMNLKGNNEEINDDIDEGSMGNMNSYVSINKKMNIPSYLSMRLSETGLIEGSDFSIEYYGSGKDKAINDYRDYDAVVLLGRYNVPNSVISDFNKMYDADMTGSEYYTNRVIQAICRTRIRKHNGEGINVYMSSDWSSDIINCVKNYLDISDTSSYEVFNESDRDIQNRLMLIKGVTPSRLVNLVKLCKYDPNLLVNLELGYNYNIKIGLNEIYGLIPMSRKEVDKYKRLIYYLSKLNVNLIID